MLPNRDDIERAAALVHATLGPTPHYAWPLLAKRLGTEIWVKHENHTPTGAFKVRGGLVYFDRLRRERTGALGVISATRGNHGQSLAFAGARAGAAVTIVVPHGNSPEKNAAMRAFGARLVEFGRDFDAAKAHASDLAERDGLVFAPAISRELISGVATYALELMSAVAGLDVLYVPIGLGSGICGCIAVREALGLKTEIVGVVSARAPGYALSFAVGRPVATDSADTFADGMAVRTPDPAALEIIRRGAARIVEVDDDAVAAAIRALFEDTHNMAEGAGAAPLAAALAERERLRGKRVGVVLTGGNIDRAVAAQVLAGETPRTA
ncbi:threonine dehydratase [Blastochloris tepida]|uniref:Serine/threonine dehydratase n=1 Tax=Blastochloris tepida TaxID=2233851 RepID=A0A348FXP8_9HYPH|nr:threonine dehydratase [Blastochloris tepida]BBF92081.1 serine/threonine dehydratase [Blastochloris tepida]